MMTQIQMPNDATRINPIVDAPRSLEDTTESTRVKTMERRPFLLQNARTFPWKDGPQRYDDQLQMSVVSCRGALIPLAALEAARTASKTEQEPGDDDPDPDAIECY